MKYLISFVLVLVSVSVSNASWFGCHVRHRVCYMPCPVHSPCPIVWVKSELTLKDEPGRSVTVDAGVGPTGSNASFSSSSIPNNINRLTASNGSYGNGGSGSYGFGTYGGINGSYGNNHGFSGNNGFGGGFGGNYGFNGNVGYNGANQGFNGSYGFGGNHGMIGCNECCVDKTPCYDVPCDNTPVHPTPAPPAVILAGIGIACLGINKLRKKLLG